MTALLIARFKCEDILDPTWEFLDLRVRRGYKITIENYARVLLEKPFKYLPLPGFFKTAPFSITTSPAKTVIEGHPLKVLPSYNE